MNRTVDSKRKQAAPNLHLKDYERYIPLAKKPRHSLYHDWGHQAMINYLIGSAAVKRLKIASTAMRCQRDPALNRAKIADTVDGIMQAHPDTELVFFGEMILGWYDPAGMPDYHQGISERIPGQSTALLGELSKKHGIFLSFGMSEKRDGAQHNTQVLLDPAGEIQAVHRKWNLKSGEKQAGYQPGRQPVTMTEIKGVATALLICSDAAHPLTMRTLISSRPELILLSLADDQDEKWFMARANARLYDAWIASANRFGQENNDWNGHSVISDPLGRLRATQVQSEGYLNCQLRFPEQHSWLPRMARLLYVKAALPWHVLSNWRIMKSYYQ